jgi:NEDD8-activating enzyme E1 regulatory subunit
MNKIKVLFVSQSKPFWIMVRALKEFVENEGNGMLPLRGTIPDMFSDSEKFINLQNVYRQKAQQDLEAIQSRIEQLLHNIDKPYDYISEHQVKLFCKNAYFLKVIRTSSLEQEYDPQLSKLDALVDDNLENDLVFYLLLRAANLFCIEHNRYPGDDLNQSLDNDILILKKYVAKFTADYGISNVSLKDDFIIEMCRYGNSELHSVAAFLGGCAAQESIKILTSQFIPINNTIVYNAVNQSTSTYEL